jgi:hypothetical protein
VAIASNEIRRDCSFTTPIWLHRASRIPHPHPSGTRTWP